MLVHEHKESKRTASSPTYFKFIFIMAKCFYIYTFYLVRRHLGHYYSGLYNMIDDFWEISFFISDSWYILPFRYPIKAFIGLD